MNKNIIFIILLIALISCNSFNRDPYSNSPTSGNTNISVDESFMLIIEAEKAVFESVYDYAQLDINYTDYNTVINSLRTDSIFLAISPYKLQKEDYQYFESKKIFPKEILIAYDAIALILNEDNPDSLLTLNQLKDILTGKITSWNQISNNNSSDKIQVVFDHQHSSAVRYLADSICSPNKLSTNLKAVKTNLQVIDFIKNNKNSIGIIGVSWISDRDDTIQLSFLKDLNVIAISTEKIANYENSYKPYPAYIHNGSYPLKRSIYAIITEPKIGLATGFASFISSEKGQRIILKSGIVPAVAPTRIISITDQF